MEVFVDDDSGSDDVPDLDAITSYVSTTLSRCGAARDEVSVRFVREDDMRDFNRVYRGRDASTNVLSFTFEDPPGTTSRILGDVLISPAVVRREAGEQAKSPAAHFAHLIVHGVLHLCGHDHEDEADARRMESLEVEILHALGFEDPYQSR